MNRLAYIDALRGYAISFVVIGHCIFMFSDLPSGIGSSFLAYGGRGVQLFFVVSAITLMTSWNQHLAGTLPFYIKRVFRIAPLWWIANAYWIFTMGTSPRYFAPDGISPLDIFLNFTLLHGLSPTAMNGIVPGGWSIAAELIFYIIFPLLATTCTTFARALIGLIILAVFRLSLNMTIATFTYQSESLRASFMEYYFANQIPVFLIGICTYHLIARWPLRPNIATLIVTSGATVAAILPYDILLGPTSISYALCWAAIAYGLAYDGARILVNRVACFIGSISYSAYFWHFIVLNNPADLPKITGGQPSLFKLVALTFAITIPLSWLTYVCIEKPFIRLGARLIDNLMRWRAKRAVELSHTPPLST
jgi:exopolysaccharide production protein ExoZ